MRVLFCMSHAGFARNFESTLREIVARGYEVVVTLDHPERGGPGADDHLLTALAAEIDGLRVRALDEHGQGGWRATGLHLRRALDLLHFLEPAYARSIGPRRRAEAHVPHALVRLAKIAWLRPALRRALRAAQAATPVDPVIVAVLREERPDVVCVTPLVDLGSPQVEHVRAARALGVPSALCVASWDNLTMRGAIHDPPDLVCVWNERQRDEAVTLHGVPPHRCAVTGAVAYDHWFARRPSRERGVFCRTMGLPDDRPYVLYVGSSSFIAPGEGTWIDAWLAAVRGGPELEGVAVLVRPHPTNPPTEAERARLAGHAGVAVHPARGANPTTPSARADYFDAMAHAGAVVGVNTSAFVESAIVGRPIHTLLTERYATTQEGTLHFQHLLPDAGGVLRAARTPAEHRAQLAASLALAGGVATAAAAPFVASFVRPAGLQRAAGSVLAEAIEALAARGLVSGGCPPPPAPGGRALACLTRLALAAALRVPGVRA